MQSSHEPRIADAVVDASRPFLKPFRYDGGAVFPDFVLLDTTLQVGGATDAPFIFIEHPAGEVIAVAPRERPDLDGAWLARADKARAWGRGRRPRRTA
jgi:hypothetical protein